MAINAFEICEKNLTPQLVACKVATQPAGRFVRVSFDQGEKRRQKKKKASPYLNGEKVQLLSRITEKRFVHKKNDLFSSFPEAANLYRASSGELKALKRAKQAKPKPTKKSVLTLPNDPAPIPQSCTASDMNDSEYLNRNTNKKRTTRNKTVRDKGFEYYDRDAYHLRDCSSTNLIKNYDGDGKKDMNRMSKSKSPDVTAQDVWAVLRNINQFQFRSSPLSESSAKAPKKRNTFLKKHTKMRNGRRLIETCRTEEIAYVANFEIKGNPESRSSSFDRITVINRNDLQEEESNNLVTPKLGNKPKNLIPPTDRNLNRLSPRSTIRALQQNKRFELVNKYRAKLPQNAVKENIDSTCTVLDSVDSSNCARICEGKNLTTDCKNKILKHPNEIQEIISNINGAKNLNMLSSVERLTKGMTRMVFNDTNIFSGKYNVLKPKPRLVTTMPSAAAMPSFTTTDIKRRLAQIKFPIVVLGKDQVSSNIEVLDFDHPQFNGLDEHIWPFMVDWGKKSKGRNGLQNKHITEQIAQNLRKVNNELSVIRKTKVNNADNKKNRTEDERSPSPKKQKPIRQFKDKMLRLLYKKSSASAIQPRQEPVKNESIKEPNNEKIDVCTETAVTASKEKEEITKIGPKKLDDIIKSSKRPNLLPPILSSKFPGARHPWARGKWASDVIENVIKKITNGAYYRQEGKCNLNENAIDEVCLVDDVIPSIKFIDTGTLVDFNDVSVQTFDVSIFSDERKEVSGTENEIIKVTTACEPYLPIPGFDDVLPELEIKTMNFNQIAVKHRLSNVMVQFDVAVPNKASGHMITGKISTSSSCIPLSVTDSHTKIFKCNTTILNAVLPAELCSVLPKVMRNIFDSDTSLNIYSVTDSYATISEISELETPTPSISTCTPGPNDTRLATVSDQWIYNPCLYPPNQLMPPQRICENQLPSDVRNNMIGIYGASWIANRPWLPLNEYVPHELPMALKNYIYGWFSPLGQQLYQLKKISNDVLLQRISLKWSENTVPSTVCIKAVLPIVVEPRNLHMWPADKQCNDTSTQKSIEMVLPKQTTNCVLESKALQPYLGPNKRWIPTLKDFKSLLQETWNYCKFNIHLTMPSFLNPQQLDCNEESITVDVVVGDGHGVEKRMSVTVTNLKIDSLFSRSGKRQLNAMAITDNCIPIQSVECSENSSTENVSTIAGHSAPAKKSPEKPRKKRYLKLYKKCKSTSNISGERLCTSLSKIANLDDFFQALGSAKALSSVFDGCAGQKVMTCLDELKNWIKDITPRQALLILLLSNKQDTPNLVRFRPVLLQGIAVNRITRATELDMEIQVIEGENLNLSQYEGISYIPASMDNQDSLLEELSWIAKTTASDYQKPFNDSSERLLKSLLEKRKKLNPSYLRVMARYVGLGLLKTPVKNIVRK